MRATQLLASLVFLASLLMAPPRAEAQCRTLIVGGPRVRVIAPCGLPHARVVIRSRPMLPPVVVVPAPLPVVVVPAPPMMVVLEPPAPPPPPPVLVQPVAPQMLPPPPPPMVQLTYPRPQLFTLGMYGEGTMFKDGGLGGGGFFAQFRLSHALHLHGALGFAGSCTNCNSEDPKRVDVKTSLGLQYYFLDHGRIAPFVRGSLVYQRVRFHDPNDVSDEPMHHIGQIGGELAAGLELRLLRWLVLSADVAYLGLKRLGTEYEGALPADAGKGVATVNSSDHGATFRLNAAIRF